MEQKAPFFVVRPAEFWVQRGFVSHTRQPKTAQQHVWQNATRVVGTFPHSVRDNRQTENETNLCLTTREKK